ncbi:laaL [Latilactobacillus fragifolii]|uniref:laaL n=1 Tax=Latilactobacillus fragifolii TaxID=2814244 RepID=UPI001ABA5B01|nr:laaL [Latilactobacillus fragifolii]
MTGFTLFYGLLAIALFVIWLIVETKMVWRAKRNRLWTIFLCCVGILLLGLTLAMGRTLSDQITGLGSVVILIVIAFWPRGLTKTSLIANLNTIRQFAAISKIELLTQDDFVEVHFYVGEIRIAKLRFKTTVEKLQAFLKERFPKKRLVVK